MNWEIVGPLLADAVKTIGEVVASVKSRRAADGIGSAADALTVIGAVVESVKHGDLAHVDPTEVADDLARLKRALGENDAAADDALTKKFDRSSDD